MTNQVQDSKSPARFDLADRTARFGESIIVFARGLPTDPVVRPLISQLVRAGTGIGANYMEADSAESRKDFRHKILLAKKETQETMHWLRMTATAHPPAQLECRELWKEAHELALIFGKIVRTMDAKK